MGKRIRSAGRAYTIAELKELEELIIALIAFEGIVDSSQINQETESMTALFPTYTSLWHRAKRLLATDLTPLWERFLDACEADEQRYINESRAKGLDDFDCFGFGTFR